MKPERLPSAQTLENLMERLGTEPIDLELFVLKSHLIVERELYWLLAKRLEIEERYLPPLQYFPLAKLALAGEPYKLTLVKVLALNDLRNEFSHQLEEEELQAQYATFCERLQVFWPKTDPLALAERVAALRDSTVRLAAFSCIGDVWAHIAEWSLAHNVYASAAEADHARRALQATHEQAHLISRQQRSARQYWEALSNT